MHATEVVERMDEADQNGLEKPEKEAG